jgi:flagellar assembly protein FliH
MPDSSPDRAASSEITPQPFRYAPVGSDGRESVASHSVSDQALQKAYEKGFSEGKASARADFENATSELRSQISGTIREFAKNREEYFGRVESEVVRLSLSIARKILHRESQIDPLVLTGVVHVALQKLNSETRVRLRTHSDDVRFWSDYYKQAKDIYPIVEVVGDPSLPQGHCTLETDFGSTQISLETQLKEIEQGFFDLLEQRPKGGE